MPQMQSSRRALRRALTAAAVMVVGILVGAAVYSTAVEPGAAIVKAAFEAGDGVTPPAGYAALAAGVRDAGTTIVHSDATPDARLRVYTPRTADNTQHTAGTPSDTTSGTPGTTPRPMILWIHGGGFIANSADTVEDYAVMLAAQGYVVGSLDYSLAPGARYPAPVVQANAALRNLVEQASRYGGDATRIFVGGDSAGAQIASEVAAALTSPTLAAALPIAPAIPASHVAGVILFCGLYDMSTVAATGFPALRTFLWAYTGERDWQRFPRIDELSTARTATDAYPPTFLTVGNADPFAAQGRELAAALRARSVAVTTLFWSATAPRLGHEYQFDFTKPQARTAFADTVEFLRQRSGR